MSNKWLFFPTPASGADWSDAWVSSDFIGSCVADGNAGSLANPFSLVTGALAGNVETTRQFQRAGGDTMDTKGPAYASLWYAEGMRYMVWFFEGLGWQKSPYMGVWYANSRTQWNVGTSFFFSGYDVGDYAPIVFAAFSGDPGDVSTWTDYTGPTAYRQTVTYTMNGSNGVSAVSGVTGDEIFKVSAYTWPPFFHYNTTSAGSQVRFVMGSYTSGYTNAQVGTLISSLRCSYSINGGAPVVLGAPLWLSANATWYINEQAGLNNTSGLVNGDTIQFFLSDI